MWKIFLRGTAFICFIILTGSSHIFAQGNVLKPLQVGDVVPDIFLGKTLNYPKDNLRISDFRGKLLILDFWSVWCSVCIKQFPQIESLQEEFREKIMILPVGFDGFRDGSIQEFINKRKNSANEMRLPTTIQRNHDTVLSTLFPGQGLPREIWISPEGKLLGITNHKALTKENIISILTGKEINFGIITKRFGVNTSSFLLKGMDDANLEVYGSAFSGYIDTLSNGNIFSRQTTTSYLHLFDVNKSVFQYYQYAYNDLFHGTLNKKRILKIVSPNRTFYKDWDDAKGLDNWDIDAFKNENLFCYELRLPKYYTLNEAYRIMRQNIDDYFQIKSEIEIRKVKCLELTKSNISYPELSKVKNFDNGEPRAEQAYSVEELISILDNILTTNLPIINETNYPGNIQIRIPTKATDILEINGILKSIGFELIEVERELPMLVLNDMR